MTTNDLGRFGKGFARLRARRAWSQDALAQAAGCARSTIARWESGRQPPNEEGLKRCLRILKPGCPDLAELYAWSGRPSLWEELAIGEADYLPAICEIVAGARSHLGWSEERLAQAIEMTQGSVSRFENGKQAWSTETLERALEELRVSEEDAATARGRNDAMAEEILGCECLEEITARFHYESFPHAVAYRALQLQWPKARTSPREFGRLFEIMLWGGFGMLATGRYGELKRWCARAHDLDHRVKVQDESLTSMAVLDAIADRRLLGRASLAEKKRYAGLSEARFARGNAWPLMDLAGVCGELGDQEGARRAAEDAVRVIEAAGGRVPPHLARAFALAGDLERAERMLDDLTERKDLRADVPESGMAAQTYALCDRWEEAEAALGRAAAAYEGMIGQGHARQAANGWDIFVLPAIARLEGRSGGRPS